MDMDVGEAGSGEGKRSDRTIGQKAVPAVAGAVYRDSMHKTVHPDFNLNIRLELRSHSEEVLLARELLSGVAEAMDIGVESMDDIRTAVTEACNNVVQHAYDGTPGPIELDLALLDEALEVTVRDHGGGMHPWIRTPRDDALGIGLMVIKALSESVEFRDGPKGGMEVQMRFSTPGIAALDPGSKAPQALDPVDSASASASMSVAIGPVSLAATVLPRLLSAMAARAHFSTDRISDLQLIADAIAAHAAQAIDGGHLCLRIAADPRLIRFGISPLLAGGGAKLLKDTSIEGLGGVIERLSDEQQISRQGDAEALLISVRDARS